MLVYNHWRPEMAGEGCRVQRWMPLPAERFAPYLARPTALPPLPPLPQTEDEDSSGGSSPEREATDIVEELVAKLPHTTGATNSSTNSDVSICEWRGCGMQFATVARLSAHVARVHALAHRDGMFYCAWRGCPRPQRGFNARYKMLVHVRTHTNERPHACNQCQKSFSRAENLKIHLRSHSGEKPYVCPYEGCGKAYSNSSDRFKHTRTHTVDKPYCCKVVGCNKRYTDPSSLRKHVKTYKHFVTDDKRESSEDEPFSPLRDHHNEPRSPLHGRIPYSPPRVTISPTIPPYNPILPLANPVLPLPYDQVTYMTPLEPMYPAKVQHEMSYVDYTQMYEHTYGSYYTSMNYSVLRPTVIEKAYSYEEKRPEDVIMTEEKASESYDSEMPLNLICTKRECPIEDLVRRTDLPLDLSTKS